MLQRFFGGEKSLKTRKKSKYFWISIGMVLLSVLYVIKKAVSSGLSGMISDGIKSVVPFIFLILGIILFFFGDVLEKRENKKKREEELKNSFPEFALKVSMLIRAGFTPKGAFEKAGSNYLRKREKENAPKDVLYEEVLISLREMESGVSQKDAYEHFEKRCNVFEITRFSGLLIRAVKRGNTALGEELKEESQEKRADRSDRSPCARRGRMVHRMEDGRFLIDQAGT